MNGTKYTRAIFCLILCVFVEIASIGATISFDLAHDGTDFTCLIRASYILTTTAVIVQLLSCSLFCYAAHEASKVEGKCDSGYTVGCACIGVLSTPSLGPLQIAATILMTVTAANSDVQSIQGFAGAIIAINFTAVILSVAYGVFFYLPLDKHKNINHISLQLY